MLNFQITIHNIFQKCLATLTKSHYHLIFKKQQVFDKWLVHQIEPNVSSDSKGGNKNRLAFTDALINFNFCTLGTIGSGESFDQKQQVELMVNLNPKNVIKNDDSLTEID